MPEVSTKNRIAIEVDRALCYGFGDCVDTVPEVFALDDEVHASFFRNWRTSFDRCFMSSCFISIFTRSGPGRR